MKHKGINIITACLLLVSTTGFTLSRHYCGEVLVEVAVNNQAESCCSNPDCCDTETDFYQLDDDFVASFTASFKPVKLPSDNLISIAYSFHAEKNINGNLIAFPDRISLPVRQRFQAVSQVFLL